MVIYTITNLVNNRKYIGQSANQRKRWNIHLETLQKGTHHNIFLQRAWNKYGAEAFEWDVVFDSDDIIEINEIEKLLIEQNTSGYNIRAGGNHAPMAESTKKKLSKIAKNRPRRTHEDRLKSSKLNRPQGYPILLSPDNKEVQIDVLKEFCRDNNLVYTGLRSVITGETFHYKGWRLLTTSYKKLDTNLNISKAMRPQGYPKVYDTQGNEYTIIDSLNKFCKSHNLSCGLMSRVINGKQLSHKGWKLSQI